VYALFQPVDHLGMRRSVVLASGVVIGAFTLIHSGTEIGEGARVEDRTIVGQPELGYAVREHHSGAGMTTVLEAGVVVRAGAILYAGVRVGERSAIGHQTVIRSHISIGAESLLGHGMSIEQAALWHATSSGAIPIRWCTPANCCLPWPPRRRPRRTW